MRVQALAEIRSLTQRAGWLIHLRWVAATALGAGTFVCARVLDVPVREGWLYGVVLLLLVYNGVARLALNHPAGSDRRRSRWIRGLVNLQISADLVILTVVLHLSGGPENPFVFFYIFHMIIASILLSVWESYLQATVAVVLLSLLLLFESTGVLRHHCLQGVVVQCRYGERTYLVGLVLVFALTLYLVVYMASYIAVRLRRAEHAQRQANEQLREKDRVKDVYVARLTHDIKGHIAAIQACLGVALTGAISGQAAEFVDRAYRRAQKLTVFVRMLLRLTRLKLDPDLEKDVYPVGEVLEQAVGAVRPEAEAKALHLELAIDRGCADLRGNRDAIEETLTHLLRNAVKYTLPQGTISVRMRPVRGSIVIEISDTGIGIPDAERERVFDEFYRATNARKLVRDGTGLGLSLAKHVIETHGGTIEMASEEGRGTTCRVVLPHAMPSYVSRPTLVGIASCR